MSAAIRQMHLGVFVLGAGNHSAGWRWDGAAVSNNDLAVIQEIARIAKRGKSGTPHAMTWTSLEPGVVVRDVPMPESEAGWGMVVEINGVRVH